MKMAYDFPVSSFILFIQSFTYKLNKNRVYKISYLKMLLMMFWCLVILYLLAG